MTGEFPHLPIDDVLDKLLGQLQSHNAAILVAPPGAGKTTRVPLAFLDQDWTKGKQIIVLEPRRIAARSAANYMAKLLGEPIGQTIGYRVRMDSKVGPKTRIIVVTGGVFTRMILDDPELSRVAVVLFDEYHERSLDADLGLALALDVQSALRPDLRIVPMSATLDGARVSQLFENAKIIESEGRAFPIEIRHLETSPNTRIAEEMAGAIVKISKLENGSMLCFLPGQGEIKRCAELLNGKLGKIDLVTPLYGGLNSTEQDLAIKPADKGTRKIVLATSIAETSITIDGVRVVIDSGLARVPRFEPNIGITRLETIKASKASITQRAGRAGRTQLGITYRLWHEGQTNALPDFERPEILEADLSSLVLDLAIWGVSDPDQLKWIDPPTKIAWKEASALLHRLGALDDKNNITADGKAMRERALPPRLSRMVLDAVKFGQQRQATILGLLLSERSVGGNSPDIEHRYESFLKENSARAKSIAKMADSICRNLDAKNVTTDTLSPGALLSLAYPDRIAKQIGSNDHGDFLYQLANGRRARLDGISQLAKHDYLTVAELQGKAASSRIISAAPIEIDEIHLLHKDQISKSRKIEFSPDSKRFKASETILLGRLMLSSQPSKILPNDALAEGFIEAIRNKGLAFIGLNHNQNDHNLAKDFRARLSFLHHQNLDDFPNVDDDILLDNLEHWLLPFIENTKELNDISAQKIVDGLKHFVGFEKSSEADALVPTHFKAPTGSNIRLIYHDDKIVLPIRVQELFGLGTHPTALNGAFPLTLELLSPGHKPIQMTKDLVGFWAGSWQDVKKEMKGRYPKHFWPDDPANAAPTTRIKRKS